MRAISEVAKGLRPRMAAAALALTLLSIAQPGAAETGAVFGAAGFACATAIIDEQGSEPREDHIDLAAALQTCWSKTDLVQSCPGSDLSRCAVMVRDRVVAARYANAARGAALPQDIRREIYVLTSLRRPERWDRCIADHGGNVEAASSSTEDLIRALRKQRIAAATCEMIFGLIDISVTEGMLLFVERNR